MTRFTCPLLLCILLLVFSCGGGSVKKDPASSHPAMRQLQKGLAWYQRGCFQLSIEKIKDFRFIGFFTRYNSSIIGHLHHIFRRQASAEGFILFSSRIAVMALPKGNGNPWWFIAGHCKPGNGQKVRLAVHMGSHKGNRHGVRGYS